ncbi:hypothetical protein CDD80_5382 [Ophiocordyceps camponoti-rufipedis]|uniref:Uncharacterized protein n=1 Tax=Ophiocordyceps camponoti-rufipedis TaxID=2004952 RepID=A0A2C5ZBF2_9HYPO|nr:hypothetical protein CDD80_5382 [Ophiocordyceps camponoti-rufipedis]
MNVRHPVHIDTLYFHPPLATDESSISPLSSLLLTPHPLSYLHGLSSLSPFLEPLVTQRPRRAMKPLADGLVGQSLVPQGFVKYLGHLHAVPIGHLPERSDDVSEARELH